MMLDTHDSTEGGGVIEGDILCTSFRDFLLVPPTLSVFVSVAEKASRAVRRVPGSSTVNTLPT